MKFNKVYDNWNDLIGYECNGYFIIKYWTWANSYSWIINKDGKYSYNANEYSKAIDNGDIIICESLKDAKEKVKEKIDLIKEVDANY